MSLVPPGVSKLSTSYSLDPWGARLIPGTETAERGELFVFSVLEAFLYQERSDAGEHRPPGPVRLSLCSIPFRSMPCTDIKGVTQPIRKKLLMKLH